MQTLDDISIDGKRLLIRQDLNVPLDQDKITSTARLQAALPTLQQAVQRGAGVLVMSHLGRPEEGSADPKLSLRPVAKWLSDALDQPVPLEEKYLDATVAVQPGQVKVLENVRFNAGEKANDDQLARQYADLCDVFVMDAFGTAHRAQASTAGVARLAGQAVAGPLLVAELNALGRALRDPARPVVAIVGGAKVSSKLSLLNTMLDKVDRLIVGGGIANTFLAAAGHAVGKSLHEPDLVGQAKAILAKARAAGKQIPLPTDVVVADEFDADAAATIKPVADVTGDDMILDFGPDTAKRLAGLLMDAGTIIWNGPVGVFEFDAFADGTRVLAQAIAQSSGFSIAGGGDTLAAIDRFDVTDGVSYISTGGGAFLEFLQGKTLPAVAALEEAARNRT